MAKTNSKRKTRSDKFPLSLHATGQYCKKVKGKFYYFGKDRRIALERYRAGRKVSSASYLGGLSSKIA